MDNEETNCQNAYLSSGGLWLPLAAMPQRLITCGEQFNCCSCGGEDCGCAYCFDCQACEACKEERE